MSFELPEMPEFGLFSELDCLMSCKYDSLESVSRCTSPLVYNDSLDPYKSSEQLNNYINVTDSFDIQQPNCYFTESLFPVKFDHSSDNLAADSCKSDIDFPDFSLDSSLGTDQQEPISFSNILLDNPNHSSKTDSFGSKTFEPQHVTSDILNFYGGQSENALKISSEPSSKFSDDRKSFIPVEISQITDKEILHNIDLVDSTRGDQKKPTSLLPIKIIVKSQKQEKVYTPSKMVAPVLITKPSFSLVQVPGDAALSRRISIIRKGGKLIPETTRKEDGESNFNCHKLPENEEKSCENVFQTGRPTVRVVRKITKTPKLNSVSIERPNKPSSLIKELPFRSLKRDGGTSSNMKRLKRSRKVKAYELDPLVDPVMERCRRNAVNAKRNREFKKAKFMELKAEIEAANEKSQILVGENEYLRKERDELKERVEQLTKALHDPSKLTTLLKELSKLETSELLQRGDNSEDMLNAHRVLKLSELPT